MTHPFHAVRSFVAVLVAGSFFAFSGCSGSATSSVKFFNEEFLSNPTLDSIDLSLVPGEDAKLMAEWGEEPGHYSQRSGIQVVNAGEPWVLRISGLNPSTRYHYRVFAAPAASPEGTKLHARREHTFHTLRKAGESVRFAFTADSHVFGHWAREQLEGGDEGWRHGLWTLDAIGVEDPDFLLIGGDEARTSSGRAPAAEIDGEIVAAGPINDLRSAHLRYRVMRRFYERIGHSVPVVYTLGNHDGEAGWVDDFRYFENTAEASLQARLQHFPNGAEVYSGGPLGNYYALETGDLLVVVLDVMRYNLELPQAPEDWTLGKEQLAWLEGVLASSRHPWKILVAHHLVGGSTFYGRGSVRPVFDSDGDGELDSGDLSTPFLGQQAFVHCLMLKYGAQFFLRGHDHVFALGEKRDPQDRGEGVYYVAAGTPTKRPYWAKRRRFEQMYDWEQHPVYDGFGDYFRSDYDLDGDGLAESKGLPDLGFWMFEFAGAHKVRLRMIRTDTTGGALDGERFSLQLKHEDVNRGNRSLL